MLTSCKTSIEHTLTNDRRFTRQIVYIDVEQRLIPYMIVATSRWYAATGIEFRFSSMSNIRAEVREYVIVNGEEVRGAVYYDSKTSEPFQILLSQNRFMEGYEPATRTLTHELGHVLGLEHYSGETIMMNRTEPFVKITKKIVDDVCLKNVCLWANPE